MRDIGVVIVAAGSGSRAGGEEPKQFRWIAGKPMLLHSIQRFQARDDVACVVCVLPRDRVGDPPPWIFQSDIDRLLLSVGGAERIDSVRNGLDDLPDNVPYILVHDAARPLAPPSLIDTVVREMRLGRAVVPVLPLSDTIREVDEKSSIVRTLDRSRLVRSQTPQGFPRELLLAAHSNALRRGLTATDDAALCELAGIPVQAVEGSDLAMKITIELDFHIAETLAQMSE